MNLATRIPLPLLRYLPQVPFVSTLHLLTAADLDALGWSMEDWCRDANERIVRVTTENASALRQELLEVWWWAATWLVLGTDRPHPKFDCGAVGWTLIVLRDLTFMLDMLEAKGQRAFLRQHRPVPFRPALRAMKHAWAEAQARFNHAIRRDYAEPTPRVPVWTDEWGQEHAIVWPDSPETTMRMRARALGRADVESQYTCR